jgi:hypothetical protein
MPPPHDFFCTKKSNNLTRLREDRCLSPCKVLGLDRTKMFHVKHFCKVRPARDTPQHVELHALRRHLQNETIMVIAAKFIDTMDVDRMRA